MKKYFIGLIPINCIFTLARPQLILQETMQWKKTHLIDLIIISETRTYISHHYQENSISSDRGSYSDDVLVYIQQATF